MISKIWSIAYWWANTVVSIFFTKLEKTEKESNDSKRNNDIKNFCFEGCNDIKIIKYLKKFFLNEISR